VSFNRSLLFCRWRDGSIITVSNAEPMQ
jgi:hypothetical protein